MSVINQKHGGVIPYQIDLIRDFSVLTHSLSEADRAKLAEQLKPLFGSDESNLVFKSAASFEAELSNIIQAGSETSLVPAYLQDVIDQAYHLESDLIELRELDTGLYYDFDNLSSLSEGFDFYVAMPKELDKLSLPNLSYESMSVTSAVMQMRSDVYPTLRPGTVVEIHASENIEGIPFDVFEKYSPMELRGEEILFIMSQLSTVSDGDVATLLRHVFVMAQDSQMYTANDLLYCFELIGGLCQDLDLTVDQIVSLMKDNHITSFDHLDSLSRLADPASRLSQENPIHDQLAIEAEVMNAEAITNVYRLVSDLTKSVKEEFGGAADQHQGLTFDEAKARLDFVEEWLLAHTTSEASEDKNRTTYLLTQSIQRSFYDCDVKSFFAVAVAHEMGWPLGIVSVPGHIFTVWDDQQGVRFYYDNYRVSSDEYYIDHYQVADSALEKGQLKTLSKRQVLGLVYMNRGCYQAHDPNLSYEEQRYRAIADFDMALKKDSSQILFFCNRGLDRFRLWASFQDKRSPEELATMEKQIRRDMRSVFQLDSDFYYPYYVFSQIHYVKGDYVTAIESLEVVLTKLSPQEDIMYRNRYETMIQIFRKEKNMKNHV
jgi:tetratricopeptide (TPR) repeat protein